MQVLLCGALPQGPGAQIEEQDSDEAPEAQLASQPVPTASKGAGRRAKKKGKKTSKGTARAAAKDAQHAPAEEDDIDAQLQALGLVSAKSLAASRKLQTCPAHINAEGTKCARRGPASAPAARSHTHTAAWQCEEVFCGCWRS